MNIVTILKKITHIPNKLVVSSTWYNEDFWGGSLKFKKQQFNTEVVNLGSGVALHAFNYSQLPIKGANWALAPQSLAHDFSILRNYFSYLKEGAVVFITICPFSCLIATYGKEHNFKYYPILHPATIKNFDDNERTKAYLIYQNPFKEIPYYCVKRTIKEYLCKIVSLFWKKNKVNYEDSAKAVVRSWKRQFSIDDFKEPLSNHHIVEQKERKLLLNEMITFCKIRGLRPIITIPPVHPELRKLLPQTFRDNYIGKFLDNIDAPIYDYLDDCDFNDDILFESALLLNKRGSLLFTKSLIKKLDI